ELGLQEPADLSSSETCALLLIDSHKDINQINIAQRLHLAPASIVSLIDELEKIGLVTRQTPKCDRRKYQICLTKKGKTVVGKIKLATNLIENRIKATLSDTEIEILHSALEKIATNSNYPQKSTNNQKPNRKEVKNEIPSAKRHVAS
ncbi:hypothetical protein A2164_03015, partial [Candidatus Curtissbacteria bacterium RBG_13_35_7]